MKTKTLVLIAGIMRGITLGVAAMTIAFVVHFFMTFTDTPSQRDLVQMRVFYSYLPLIGVASFMFFTLRFIPINNAMLETAANEKKVRERALLWIWVSILPVFIVSLAFLDILYRFLVNN